MKKLFFLIISIIILAVPACSKKDKTITKKDLLTSGIWRATAVMSDDDGDGTYETNDFIGFEDCYTDNDWIFRTNGELELNEGATKCAPSDPQTFMTTWQLTNNETTLVINLDTYSVEELNSSTLKIKLPLSGNRSSLITFSKH